MNDKPAFGILGTGALGAYYGSRLHHVGYPVHFLMRSDYSVVKKQGLRVESPAGDFSIVQPSVFQDFEELPLCDVLLLCAKTTANAEFLSLPLNQRLKPGGALLILQNGIGYEEEFAARFPGIRVYGGMCFLCASRIGPGHVRHLDYGDIHLASLPGADEGAQNALTCIASAFQTAGIRAPIHPDLGTARWKKLVWNIPYNGLSVLLRAGTDALMTQESSLDMVRALMQEVVNAAAACGSPLPEGLVENQLESTRRMTPYLPSMRLDWDNERPMEIEAIYDRPIARAADSGYPMPLTRQLRNALQFLQEARSLLP